MCFFGSTPSIPTPAPIPRQPQPDSQLALDRSNEAMRLAVNRKGSQSNIIADLVPSDITSTRPVLKPANAVYLGQ